MPYYLVQLPGGNLAQLFASSPEEARNKAGQHTGISPGQIFIRDSANSPFTNPMLGDDPGAYKGSHNPGGQYTQYGEGAGGTMPRQQQLDELERFRGQFYNKLGIPAYGASPFQEWQERQYGPTLAAFKLGSASNPDRTFDAYLGGRGLMGARQDLGTGYESLVGSADQGAAAEARESIGEDAWNQLMAARLRAKRGQFYGGSLARRLPVLEEQYEASPEGFEAPGTYGFLRNILQKRFGV